MHFFKRKRLILVAIIIIGLILRLIGLNWDQGFHLHPDERFLTMVGDAMKLPKAFAGYLNPQISSLNPTNIGFPFYVYGTFPVLINKLLAMVFNNDNYSSFTLQGRGFSAFLDVLNIILVFFLVRRFQLKRNKDERLAYLASFFYAIAVLPIQLSHFFTVDTFLSTFLLASLYFATEKKTVILSGIFFALAASSKVNAVYFLPPIIYFLVLENQKRWWLSILSFGIVSYALLRIASPYYFETAFFFNPLPNKHYLESLKTLKSLQSVTEGYPPGLQWAKKTPVIFSLTNLAFFGLGVGYFILTVLGMVEIFVQTVFRESKEKLLQPLLILLTWTMVIFLYQSLQLVQSMRYFFPLYPFFAIFAAYGALSLFDQKEKIWRTTCYVLIVVSVLWPLAFMSIYLRNHTRYDASNWIYKNAKDGSMMLTEHWDDSLPLSMPSHKTYLISELPVFAPDNTEKWNQIGTLLQKGNYYVLSSNRGYGSIVEVPEQYPLMSKFYKDLFAGKTEYKKVAEFTSYPSFKYLGIPFEFPDQWSEEAFTVYDHPKVMIFKKML